MRKYRIYKILPYIKLGRNQYGSVWFEVFGRTVDIVNSDPRPVPLHLVYVCE